MLKIKADGSTYKYKQYQHEDLSKKSNGFWTDPKAAYQFHWRWQFFCFQELQ